VMSHPAIKYAVVPALVWLVTVAGVRAVILVPEDCFAPEPEILRARASLAADWLIENQLGDGRYTYEYDVEQGQPTGGYNIVRHAGVTMSLYQVAGKLENREAFEAAERGTEWLIENLHEHEDWVGPEEAGNIKVGAAGLMTVALGERRLLTGEDRYDDVMRGLGRFMRSQQRDDGGYYTKWFVESQEMDRVSTSAYYPGEALWGLAMLHEAFPGEGWDEAAWNTADFVTLRRDEVEDIPFPPLNDHWASYGLAEMAEWGLEEHHADYARGMAGRFSLLIRFEDQKTDEDLGWLTRGPERRAAALGTWVEGASALWRLSAADERLADLQDDLRDRSACGAGILVDRQVMDTASAELDGAWFDGGLTRMDDQQHAISGLLYTADALEGHERREPERLSGVGGD
ncbi:MAG: hypothetical protein ACOC9Y_07550, partial [Chloroflexota bacterium]